MCGGYLSIYFYDYIRLTQTVSSPCDRLAPSLLVICLRIFVTIPSNALIICFYVVAIERLLCTVFLVNYEKSSYPKLITFVIIFMTIIVSCVGTYLLFGRANLNELLIYSSSKNSGNVGGYTIWVYTFLVAEFLYS
uniref:Uncharacterized protein n=1 Tax=Panagrolaimus davidi TaxID=227884 RepID=A0A914PL40_9BILA